MLLAPTGLTTHIDLALVMLYLFWAFFAGLIFYLRREDRREGYPLLSEVDGRPENPGAIWVPDPKVFALPHGGTASAPSDAGADTREVRARPVAPWSGAPLEPTGNPMLDGVGPAAWANRADTPDLASDGKPKIVPLRAAPDYHVEARDPDPRGMKVIAGDGKVAGTVSDGWVDRSEVLIRYLEVDVAGAAPPRRVLVPMGFAVIHARPARVVVNSIHARHFADVPATKNPDQITLREEDRISAYYGGGTLYATPQRTESML